MKVQPQPQGAPFASRKIDSSKSWSVPNDIWPASSIVCIQTLCQANCQCILHAVVPVSQSTLASMKHSQYQASRVLCVVQDQVLELQYKTCYARILDAKRRFLEAATRYYDLSQIETLEINGQKVSDLLLHSPRLLAVPTSSCRLLSSDNTCMAVFLLISEYNITRRALLAFPGQKGC